MKKLFLLIFDVTFVMLLCFATLLTTMLMQGGLLVGGDGSGINYSFNPLTFVITMGGLILYMVYILRVSDKELKSMINERYKEEDISE